MQPLKPLLEQRVDVVLEKENNLVLVNDDYNTFEHVIRCLVKYCKHDEIQAEQCAHLVHYTGKCIVKSGDIKHIYPIAEALMDMGLTVEID